MFPLHLALGSRFMPFYEGAYFAIAILGGILLGTRTLKNHGLQESEYEKVIYAAIIAALLGGRLFHVLFWGGSYYFRNPLKILAFWEGGISITGGIAGALIATLVICTKLKASFWQYLALASPSMFFAQGLGRIGCFLNGDAFGISSSLPWAVSFRRFGLDLFSFRENTGISSAAWNWSYSKGLVGPESTMSSSLHPTQLYEALFDFCLAALLLRLIKNKVLDKIIGSVYIAAYSLFRFFVEYIRADREGLLFFNTSLIQFVLLGIALAFAVYLAKLSGKVVKRME